MTTLDDRILAFLQAHQIPWVTSFMKVLSTVASGKACCIWAGLIAAYLVFHRRFARAAILFFGTVASAILVELLKLVFSRARPPNSGVFDSYSFPSGHALSCTVFLGATAWILSLSHHSHRKFFYAVATLLTLLVGISRLYLGRHWPSDVLGGFIIGFIFLRGWLWITPRL